MDYALALNVKRNGKRHEHETFLQHKHLLVVLATIVSSKLPFNYRTDRQLYH